MANQFLINPATGGISFGFIEEMNSRGETFPAGDIRLLTGKHIGVNRGFGAAHIWAEHSPEMGQKGFLTPHDVPAYVATIVMPGTPLFYEGGSFRYMRMMAVRSATGTAILELKERREGTIWSIVTAYSGSRAHGTKVGTVR